MTGPAIAIKVVGTIRMRAESHRGRVVRKNVMIALNKAQGEQIFRFASAIEVNRLLLKWLMSISFLWSRLFFFLVFRDQVSNKNLVPPTADICRARMPAEVFFRNFGISIAMLA